MAYFLVGYLIIERKIKNYLQLDYIMLLIPIMVLTIYEIYTKRFHEEFHWYASSLFIFVSSVGLFLLIKYYFGKSNIHTYTYNISKLSFGVYLIHHLILYVILYRLRNIIPKLIFGTKYFFVFIIVFLLSYVVVYFVSKVKILRFFIE